MNRKIFAVLFALATILSLATSSRVSANAQTNDSTVLTADWGGGGDWGCPPSECTGSGSGG